LDVGQPDARVTYLVEVCDPSEAGENGYQVNGVLVSDFYTPNFFDPVAADGVRYSFTGAVEAPLTVLPGGYISWQDLDPGEMMPPRNLPDQFSLVTPPVLNPPQKTNFEELKRAQSVRAAIDRVTIPPLYAAGIKGKTRKKLDSHAYNVRKS